MVFLIKWLMTYIRREEGATAIEYALLVALIAVAIIVVLGLVGVELNAIFNAIKEALAGAT